MLSSAPPATESWATHLLAAAWPRMTDRLVIETRRNESKSLRPRFAAASPGTRTCQKDNTCVLCDACWVLEPPGPRGLLPRARRRVLRLGDPEAWVPRTLREHRASSRRISSSLPPGLRQAGEVVGGKQRVVGAAVRAAARTTLQLEPGLLHHRTERGDGVVIDFPQRSEGRGSVFESDCRRRRPLLR